MCLAIPMKLIKRDEFEGTVELDGIRRSISMMLLPEAEVGDHVLVHAGYAIGTINEENFGIIDGKVSKCGDAVNACANDEYIKVGGFFK